MNNDKFYVLIEYDSLGLNNSTVLGIYDYESGANEIQKLTELYNDKKYKLQGPFTLNTSNNNYLLPKPYPHMPKPHPIVPPLQPDIRKIPNPDIFPKDIFPKDFNDIL